PSSFWPFPWGTESALAQAYPPPGSGPPPAGSPPVPTANPKRLTATANRLIFAPDERALQVDLVRADRIVPVAGCVGSRGPGPSTPTQRAAAQIPEAIGVRQY